MVGSEIRSKIVGSFKLNGLSLRSEASKFLVETLSEVETDELETWIEKIIELVQKQPLNSNFIDRDVVEIAVNECAQNVDTEGEDAFNVIDIYKVPHYVYSNERKKFVLSKKKATLFSSPDEKVDMFVEQYNILYQRALHHELFSTTAVAASSNAKSAKFTLKPIEHLLGSSSSLGDIIVLGMLSNLKEGKYFLEDPTGAVELDLSSTIYHEGIFTECTFVLAEGKYDDQIFHVTALGFPPPEPANVSRNLFGNINFFGGPSPICVANSDKMKALEDDDGYQSHMFVFLSDLWLDQPKVMSKFKVLLSGYSQMPPTVFIICGNFLSQPYGSKHQTVLKNGFKELANLINMFPSIIESSRFLFVPGPQDPGPGNILPRPPISKFITEEIRNKIPFCDFLSNPCRLQYCSQEFTIFREDLINKMCRNSIHLPDDLTNIPNHFVKTIASQAHLCPLPLATRPRYWAYDYVMRLYPLPDTVICADKFDAYNISHCGTNFVNPGSFARNEYCFKVYWPANKEIEDCKID